MSQPLLNAFWMIFCFFVWIMWLMLLFRIYLVARGDGMASRAQAQALKTSGAITDAEFEQAKQKLLAA